MNQRKTTRAAEGRQGRLVAGEEDPQNEGRQTDASFGI